jgi:Sensors of blue-light using FAD
MTITRLTCYSRISIEGGAQSIAERIEDILIVSVANNRRDDVTGALIHDGTWFAQVLEGAEGAVAATFERILRDPRHTDIRLVKLQTVADRRFAGWMTLIDRNTENLDVFRHYGESEGFAPQLMLAERLQDLIEALAARKQATQEPAWPAPTPGLAASGGWKSALP